MKPREPLTHYAAILQIISVLGWDGAADAIAKDETAVRKYSDPQAARAISFPDAVRLEVAYINAGGIGTPFKTVLEARIRAATENKIISVGSFQEILSNLIRENGEALAAIVLADQSPRARRDALKEIDEAVSWLMNLKAHLENER